MKKKTFRLKLLIYPKFQLTLIAVNVLTMAAVLSFVGLQTSRSFRELRSMGLSAGLNPDHAYFKFLKFQSGNLTSYLMIAFIVGILGSTLLSLVVSNRLAGPIVRLRGYFGSIARDPGHEIRPLNFRKGDFFSDLPPVINGALDQLKTGHGDDRRTKAG